VVLFHAGFRSFSGGYVGVDVFFVISGFLITSILAREIDGGRYSILEFYRRRVLRIFPALAAVELATLAAAYFILTPSEYVDLAKSAAAVSVFSSNIYFWKSVSYFQSASAFQPLLHTWSLAVEEQYYLFFPLLLRLLSPHRSAIRAALWFILLGSLGLAILLVATKPDLAFYLLPTRAWELMLGGLTAIGNLPKPSNARFASGASLVGVALIVAPMVFYTAATPFPGITALPPTIGTALIIWSGRMGVVSQTLSRGPIVLLGRASYSIYLWHLPLIAFAAYLAGGEIPTELALFLCAASVGLGLASLVLIERPFRSYREKRDQLAVLACIGMVVVALVSGLIVASRGLPGRLEPYDAAIAAASDDKYRHHAECMTVDRFIVYPDHACHLGSPNTPATVLLWGDSHAMVTATALEQAALHRHASFLFAADADCPPGVGFDIDPHFDPGLTSQLSYRYCAEYNLRMLKLALTSPMLHTVVLSSRWTNWRIGALPNRAEAPADVRLRDASGTASSLAANRAKWERGFLTLIARLAAANKHVVIVGPIPEPNFDVPRQLHIERFGFVRPSGPITEGQYRQRHRVILTFFSELQRMRNVSFIWPYDALCKEDRCPLVESGHPMFFDQDHLSVFGARKTAYLYDGLFN
jgi:peptidoglycan/LPS O-acetylase OafA/YrhL